MKILIHQKEEFEKMKKIGKYTAQLLNEIEQIIKPGISTKDINDYSFNFMQKYNLKSACFQYKGSGKIPFPGYVCTSLNYEICHGVPSENCILKEGDIIGVDVTLILDQYHGDSCKTFGVGKISNEAKELIEITQKAMYIGIEQAFEGNHLNNIGHYIQSFITNQKKAYSIVEDYCGHGIGTKFHQAPEVQHIGQKNTGPILKEGMFFTVEPMINLGKKDTRILKDGWTVISKDYSLSAQFEHTIGISENGPIIFTQDI